MGAERRERASKRLLGAGRRLVRAPAAALASLLKVVCCCCSPPTMKFSAELLMRASAARGERSLSAGITCQEYLRKKAGLRQ